MKTYLDCIPCFFRQALAAARSASEDETVHQRVLFDRILVEQLLKVRQLKIVLVVRSKPIINDATLQDAHQAGLNAVATVITSGSAAPATILSRCSAEMLDYYRSADLIISKGQGNYESLSDRPENVFFMFKVKCPVIARNSGYDIDSPVLIASRALKKATLQNISPNFIRR